MDETVLCPMCVGRIPEAARACMHCGERFDRPEGSAPEVRLDQDQWVDLQSHLVMIRWSLSFFVILTLLGIGLSLFVAYNG